VSRSILGIPTFCEPCNSLYQSEEQPDTELFLLYYATCWSSGGKKRIGVEGGGEVGEISRSSITGRIPYFIYVVAIISI